MDAGEGDEDEAEDERVEAEPQECVGNGLSLGLA